MNVLILGATGMVGQSVLREALLDDGVSRVVTLGRGASARQHPKLHQIVHRDLLALDPVASELAGIDACFYCLGVSAVGMSDAEYTRVTHDLTMSVASTLSRLEPGMTFVFVSAAGADSTETSAAMWARVKGRAENGVLALPFRSAYVLRPGAIIPMYGIRSRTLIYRVIYSAITPFAPLLLRGFPKYVTTTERLGRAMLRLVRTGHRARVLENADIDELGRAGEGGAPDC